VSKEEVINLTGIVYFHKRRLILPFLMKLGDYLMYALTSLTPCIADLS